MSKRYLCNRNLFKFLLLIIGVIYILLIIRCVFNVLGMFMIGNKYGIRVMKDGR